MAGADSLPKRGGTRGSSFIELAIMFPLLIGLFLGVWQFGYSFYVYGELEQAVRAGARYASLLSYDPANVTGYQNAVKNVVVYGDPAGGTTPVAHGLLTSNVNVTVSFNGAEPIGVTVAINGYQLPAALYTTITLTDKPKTKFIFLGNWSPS